MAAGISSNPGTIEVVYAADRAFALPLAVSLHSLLRNLPGPARLSVHLLDAGLHPDDIERCSRIVEAGGKGSLSVIRLGADALDFRMSPDSAISRISFARVLVPGLLSGCDRVLYLDADTLILGDITPLWVEGAECGAPVAAARDFLANFQNIFLHADPYRNAERFRLLERLGIADDEPYFNAGVLWMDCRRLRAQGLEAVVRAISRDTIGLTELAEQSVLNYIFRGKWHELDYSWNYQIPMENVLNGSWKFRGQMPMQNYAPKIVHYVSAEKPWLGFRHKPYGAEFWREMALVEAVFGLPA